MRIKKRIDEEALGCAAERGTARQTSPLITLLAPRSSGDGLDAEESVLAVVGLVRLPDESRPDSFWKMPAPRVSLVDAVSAVASERDEDRRT
jgi:hypothetical protein